MQPTFSPAEPSAIDHVPTDRRLNVISLAISVGGYVSFLASILDRARRGQSGTVCFANVHMTVEAAHNPDFARAVNGADWVAPDGVPMTWALKALYGQSQDRVTGLDVLPDLLHRAAAEQLPVYFYGCTPDVLQRTLAICAERYPGLPIAGSMSPPFRPLTPAEDDEVVEQIRNSGARLVFVALGCPKQEQWIAQMRNRLPAVLLGIGGALPVLAGAVARSPQWMQKAGLEWLFRLAKEPRRLFKRYATTNSLFVYYLTRQLLTQRLRPTPNLSINDKSVSEWPEKVSANLEVNSLNTSRSADRTH